MRTDYPTITRYFSPLLLALCFCSKSVHYLPDQILDLTLTQKITGSEARLLIDHLHQKGVTSERNEIGTYGGAQGAATIYVTFYQNSATAQNEFTRMTGKISPDNSVFMMGAYLQKSGKSVYHCFGLGQTHFVFYHDNLLFWIAVETLIGEKFLNDYLIYLDG